MAPIGTPIAKSRKKISRQKSLGGGTIYQAHQAETGYRATAGIHCMLGALVVLAQYHEIIQWRNNELEFELFQKTHTQQDRAAQTTRVLD